MQADKHRRRNPEYNVGQWVWLSARDLRLHLPCRKLSPRYVGPFQITRQITPVSFELNLPNHYCISPTFHVSLLKPADDPGEGPEEPLEDADPLPYEIFWIPVWWRNSTETTREDRPPDHVEDLGVDLLLASGAARRGGGSVTQSAPTAPSPGHRREPSPEY